MVWEELFEKVIFKQKPQGVRNCHVPVLGKGITGGENFKLEVSEARTCLLCLKNNKENSVARAESTRQREDGDEGTDYDRPSRPWWRLRTLFWGHKGAIKEVRAGEEPHQIYALENSLWLHHGRQTGEFEMCIEKCFGGSEMSHLQPRVAVFTLKTLHQSFLNFSHPTTTFIMYVPYCLHHCLT